MEYLTKDIVAINENELPNDIQFMKFGLNKKYDKENPALRIDFQNRLGYSILCIKKLIKLKEKNLSFGSAYQGKTIKYIISNYSPEIIDCLKAIEIQDKRERTTFLYETLCDELDAVWKKFNPCNFCNGICAAGKTDKRYSGPDGCCAKAFDLSFWKEPFAVLTQSKFFPCPYLGEKDGCTTQNVACKLFACTYIKKNHLIELNPHDFIIYEACFSQKQKLILTYNFFRTKEQLINKLLEENRTPYYFYSSRMKYLILEKKDSSD